MPVELAMSEIWPLSIDVSRSVMIRSSMSAWPCWAWCTTRARAPMLAATATNPPRASQAAPRKAARTIVDRAASDARRWRPSISSARPKTRTSLEKLYSVAVWKCSRARRPSAALSSDASTMIAPPRASVMNEKRLRTGSASSSGCTLNRR